MSEDDEPPVMLIVAGPNGAGKSTLSSILVQRFPLLDPDAIAREEGLSPIAAGRVILSRIQNHIDKAESFIVETTLSGKTFFNAMQEAHDKGFQLELHFVGVEAPDLALERVRLRVALGGHDVPERDLRRRFERSFQNLPRAIQACDTSYLYDNSGSGHEMLAIISGERMDVAEMKTPYPAWFAALLRVLG